MTTGMFHFPVLSSFMTYHRMCNQINTTGATSGAGTAYPAVAPRFTPGFSGVRVTRSLVLCVCFLDLSLSFFYWPLCCLFFFDLRILITPLLSSNSCFLSFFVWPLCRLSFLLPFWYLQTLLTSIHHKLECVHIKAKSFETRIHYPKIKKQRLHGCCSSQSNYFVVFTDEPYIFTIIVLP